MTAPLPPGQRTKAANPPITPALLEDLHELAGWGVGRTEAATRVGYSSTKALDKALRRHYRADRHPELRQQICALLNRLSDQDYATLHTQKAS